MAFVYALMDPISNVPFYFGKGSRKDRPLVHGSPKDTVNTNKLRAINIFREFGLKHKILIVADDLSNEEALAVEEYFIAKWRQEYPHYRLTNLPRNPPPDRTGCKDSAETRLKKSLSNKGQVPWMKGRTIANGGLPPNHGEKIKAGTLAKRLKNAEV